MSGLFTSKKVEPEYKSTPQDDRINELWGMIKPKVGDYAENIMGEKYQGDLVAPLSDMENQNLSKLKSYLNSGYASQSREFGMAKDEISKIFGDAYDPFKEGSEYDYVQRRLQKSLTNDLLPTARHRAGATGSLYSSGAIDAESDEIADVMDQLASYAYKAKDTQIARRQAAIPTAMQVGEYETQEPLQRLIQTMGLAGYERTNYAQPKLTAEYQDQLRLLQELQTAMGTGTQLSSVSGGVMYTPQYQPSAFSQYVMPMLQMGTQLGSAALLGGD